MSHRGFMGGRKAGIDPCAYVPGLYTEAEVDDLINIDGYIPVASIEELEKINSGISEDMGGCTIWAGSYTTGLDKKYIQVKEIDGAEYGSFTGVGDFSNRWDGDYDGNELLLKNIDINARAMFFSGTGASVTMKNLRLSNCTNVLTSSGDRAIMLSAAVNSTISNCEADLCEIVSAAATQRCAIIVGGIVNTTLSDCRTINCTLNTPNAFQTGLIVAGVEGGCEIADISDSNSTVNGGDSTGGLIGETENLTPKTTLTRLKATATSVTGNGSAVGGLIGYQRSASFSIGESSATVTQLSGTFGCGGAVGVLNTGNPTISQVKATGAVDSTAAGTHSGTGGCVGILRSATMDDCLSTSEVNGISQVGGLVGQRRDATMNDSYSTGAASGSATVGGLVGAIVGSGSTNDSYWDTDTSGNATSAAGTGQTTTQLQTPTTASGIYADWSDLIWDFGTDTEYPELINTP